MFRLTKEWLIRILGGVTDHKYQIVIREINEKSAELEACRHFIESVNFYTGNYPAWKAQQEYQEYLHEIGLPLEKNYTNRSPINREYLDIYLGRMVDAFVVLNAKGFFKYGPDYFWN